MLERWLKLQHHCSLSPDLLEPTRRQPGRLTSHHYLATREERINPTILVVEDDPLVLEIIESNLPLDGWQVGAATNGRDALAQLDEALPDVMVLDNGVSGQGLVGRIRPSPLMLAPLSRGGGFRQRGGGMTCVVGLLKRRLDEEA